MPGRILYCEERIAGRRLVWKPAEASTPDRANYLTSPAAFCLEGIRTSKEIQSVVDTLDDSRRQVAWRQFVREYQPQSLQLISATVHVHRAAALIGENWSLYFVEVRENSLSRPYLA